MEERMVNNYVKSECRTKDILDSSASSWKVCHVRGRSRADGLG
jgi:hypothetical protein